MSIDHVHTENKTDLEGFDSIDFLESIDRKLDWICQSIYRKEKIMTETLNVLQKIEFNTRYTESNINQMLTRSRTPF